MYNIRLIIVVCGGGGVKEKVSYVFYFESTTCLLIINLFGPRISDDIYSIIIMAFCILLSSIGGRG